LDGFAAGLTEKIARLLQSGLLRNDRSLYADDSRSTHGPGIRLRPISSGQPNRQIGVRRHQKQTEVRPMNADLAQELLNQLGSSLENLETQQAALLQFLKDEGVISDEKLALYIDKASVTSEVRWRAARVRLERIISSEKEKEEQLAEKAQQKKNPSPAPIQNQPEQSAGKPDEDTNEVALQNESAAANTAKQSAGARANPEAATQSNSGKESRQDSQPNDDGKQTNTKQEKKDE
jgi:hypothetical protein